VSIGKPEEPVWTLWRKVFALPGVESQFLNLAAWGLATIPTELSRLLDLTEQTSFPGY
jgi:hypothetical protein